MRRLRNRRFKPTKSYVSILRMTVRQTGYWRNQAGVSWLGWDYFFMR